MGVWKICPPQKIKKNKVKIAQLCAFSQQALISSAVSANQIKSNHLFRQADKKNVDKMSNEKA